MEKTELKILDVKDSLDTQYNYMPWVSILGRVIAKTQKMVLDSSLFNTQHYKVWNQGKVELIRERNSAPYTY